VAPGQAETAAAGGTDRRSAKNAARPINQSREAHLAACPLHSPAGGQCTPRRFRPSSRSWRLSGNSFKARDCHKASTSDGLKPLTCRFAPPAGLEPATYGLEVDPPPSKPCCRVPFWLVRSGSPSRWCGPVALNGTWKNDRPNDRLALLRSPDRSTGFQALSASSPGLGCGRGCSGEPCGVEVEPA
jgi:hypothetical protein